MPELRNCRRCNKIFPYITGAPICLDCQREDEKIFEDVSLYVRDHPGVPLTVVAKELEVSYDKLMKYVRDGRLQIRTANGTLINFCEKCGAETTHGRFCKDCESGISRVLESSKQNLQGKVEAQNRDGYQFFAVDNKKK